MAASSVTAPPNDPHGLGASGAGSRPPMATAGSSSSGQSNSGRPGFGPELLIRLFSLITKFGPIAGVLVGGYYSYTYFFGPVTVVEAAAARLGASPTASAAQSKVGQMLQQTRDVVSANDSRVGVASSLAGDVAAGFTESEESQGNVSTTALSTFLTQTEADVAETLAAPGGIDSRSVGHV
jgi:hypothetical protein